MGALTPDTTYIPAEQATQAGYRFDPSRKVWLRPDGKPAGGSFSFLNNDPTRLKESKVGWKQIASAAGLVFGGAAAANGIGGAAAAPGAGAGPAATVAGTVPPAAGAGRSMLSTLRPYLETGGRLAGAALDARAANRSAEAGYNAVQDATALRRQQAGLDAVRTDLEQRRYLDQNYDRQTNNAIRGDLLRGLQDVSIASPSQVPRSAITGGLRPSALKNRDAIGSALYQNAMLELMNPTQPGGQTNEDGSVTPGSSRRLPAMPALPALRDVPAQGGGDLALGIADAGGSGLSLLSRLLQESRQSTTSPTPAAAPPAAPRVTGPGGYRPRVSFR